jgi:hypothetical protein
MRAGRFSFIGRRLKNEYDVTLLHPTRLRCGFFVDGAVPVRDSLWDKVHNAELKRDIVFNDTSTSN